MKPSDKDRQLDRIISRAAGEAKKPVPKFAKWLEDHPTAVKRLTSLRDTNLGGYRRKGCEPLLLRFPRLVWAVRVAAVLLLGVSCLACFVLACENRTLRQDLQLARRQIAMNDRQQQIVEAQNGQQQAISDLHVRVKELEEDVKRGVSPRMIWYSESPYYAPEWPDQL
jgi:hypothetical protein